MIFPNAPRTVLLTQGPHNETFSRTQSGDQTVHTKSDERPPSYLIKASDDPVLFAIQNRPTSHHPYALSDGGGVSNG